MRNVPSTIVLFTAALIAAGCDSSPTPTAPALSISAEHEGRGEDCPTTVNVVVTTEAELFAALAAAVPNQVVGVRGMIPVHSNVGISKQGLVLTCAQAGAGLVAQPGIAIMLTVFASGVTVDHLVLDGTNATQTAYYGLNAPDVRLTNDRLICHAVSTTPCAFFVNAPRAVVVGNRFLVSGIGVGLHMQGNTTGTLVEHNRIRTTTAGIAFGGIRVRDGTDVDVRENVVVGPWYNSMALADLSHSRIEHNRLHGAVVNGISARFGASFIAPPSVVDNFFKGNRVSGAGQAGIYLFDACRNTLSENRLRGNGGNIGLTLTTTTGANILLGDDHRGEYIVQDFGAYDCDGDGVNDPNLIRGRHERHHEHEGESDLLGGRAERGFVTPGAVVTVGGVEVQ